MGLREGEFEEERGGRRGRMRWREEVRGGWGGGRERVEKMRQGERDKGRENQGKRGGEGV